MHNLREVHCAFDRNRLLERVPDGNETGTPGGTPLRNDGGARRKFSKTPLKGARISFCGRGFEFM